MNVTGAHPDYGICLLVILGLVAFAGFCILIAGGMTQLSEKGKNGRALLVAVAEAILVLYALSNVASCVWDAANPSYHGAFDNDQPVPGHDYYKKPY